LNPFSYSEPVTILGAGLSGLAAAWRLSNQGIPVRVIEQESRVGGMARTINKNGFRFDYGPHRFYSDDSTVISLVRDLLGDELLTHKRHSRVRLDGHYLEYPPNLPNLIRSLPPSTGLRCLLDYVSAVSKRPLSRGVETDFQTWIVNRFGQKVFDINFGPYTAKVWGESPENLSADLAKLRVSAPNLAQVILRLVLPNNMAKSPYITEFYYPRSGIGRIADRLAEEVVRQGGEIWLDHSVEQFNRLDSRIDSLTVSNKRKSTTLPCDWLLSSLPLHQLIYRMTPPLHKAILHAFELPYRALIFLFIMVDRAEIGQDHWLYFPEGRFLFNRVSEPKTFSPILAPPDKTSVCAEITCDEGDELWNMSINALADQVISDLELAGLIQSSEVEGYFSDRCRWGYPVYKVGYQNHLSELKEIVSRFDNVVTFGRQGGFDYGNMSDAIASGLTAAETLLDA
jgi:protoporphyrinogen oxidase